MPGILIPLIIKQTRVIFLNAELTLSALDENLLDKPGSWGWPLGQQVYHMLRSMDQWFINPSFYQEPDFLKTSQIPESCSVSKLSKAELTEYYGSIKAKVDTYLENLTDESLSEFPLDCKFTRLELILGQYRHFNYHIGLIHGCIRSQTGHSPDFVGLSRS